MSRSLMPFFLLSLPLILACPNKDDDDDDGDGGGSDTGAPDGGTTDGGTSDGGTSDGGTSDGGTSDGGAGDGGAGDGGADGGAGDGGAGDGGADGGAGDGGFGDGGGAGDGGFGDGGGAGDGGFGDGGGAGDGGFGDGGFGDGGFGDGGFGDGGFGDGGSGGIENPYETFAGTESYDYAGGYLPAGERNCALVFLLESSSPVNPMDASCDHCEFMFEIEYKLDKRASEDDGTCEGIDLSGTYGYSSDFDGYGGSWVYAYGGGGYYYWGVAEFDGSEFRYWYGYEDYPYSYAGSIYYLTYYQYGLADIR